MLSKIVVPQEENNYGVHFMPRQPIMIEELLNYLIDEVKKLELNTENLDLHMIRKRAVGTPNTLSSFSELNT